MIDKIIVPVYERNYDWDKSDSLDDNETLNPVISGEQRIKNLLMFLK